MVKADNIIELKVAGEALDPPVVTALLHLLPVIDGITPELAGRGEGIRRAARHDGRDQVLVKFEDIGVGPGRSAVHRHIEGDIADDLDALFFRIGMQFFPLAVKFKLEETVEVDVIGKLLRRCFQSFLIPETLTLLPVGPGFSFIFFLQGHIEGIVKEPVVLSLQILLILCVIGAVAG